MTADAQEIGRRSAALPGAVNRSKIHKIEVGDCVRIPLSARFKRLAAVRREPLRSRPRELEFDS